MEAAMGIAESIKRVLKLVCEHCGGSAIKFRCSACGKKFCKTCIEFANKAVKKDLESVRSASILQKKDSVTSFVAQLIDKTSGNARQGYCPMCSITRINQLVRGKQLSKLTELNPPCAILPE
jgi:hypothetical protein